MASRSEPLFVEPRLRGLAYCEAHSAVADAWLTELFERVVEDPSDLALVAIGGYGRGRLWPASDLDVALIHRNRSDVAEVAESLWYPIWDRGLKLGHSVLTVDEAGPLIAEELDRATAFLSARIIAGDPDLVVSFTTAVAETWNDLAYGLLDKLADSVRDRRETFGDTAFRLEPDLKEGHGGLRDLHAMEWAERAAPGFASDFLTELAPQAEVLIEARVELHRTTGRPGDVLTLDDQDPVAAALGEDGGTELMMRLSQAARRIAWFSEEAWRRHARRRARSTTSRPVSVLTSEIVEAEGQIEVRRAVDVNEDPLLLLRVAETSATTGMPIGRGSLERLASSTADMPTPWPQEARDLFASMLLSGRNAIRVIESLDQFNLMLRLLPEWEHVMCRPQRNVMHTFTVDRHLCETAANAAQLADRVTQPDLLVVGALLHDIGKGLPGDHTEVGMKLIATIAERMGYDNDEVGVLVDLCRLHLLLPDVATRRDLADLGTIRAVAAAVDSVEFLDLLAALTEADSIATGPSAWGTWKAGLLEELVTRTTGVLQGDEVIVADDFPTPELLATLALGVRSVTGKGSYFTVIDKDGPGLFARGAGVLAMHGIEVLDAMAYSADNGLAVNQFVVQSSTGAPIEWDRVIELANRALDGRIALTARISQRARNYSRYQRRLAAAPPRRFVAIDNSISDSATVVDVHAPDSIGLLYRMTRALAELRLDIKTAKVQTLGPEAVDSFYITDVDGKKLDDPELLRELELALTEAMGADDR